MDEQNCRHSFRGRTLYGRRRGRPCHRVVGRGAWTVSIPDPIRVRYQAGEIRRTEDVLYDVLVSIHVLQRDWPETSYYNIGTLSETVIAFRPNSILEVGGGNRTPDSKIAMRVS